MTEANKDLHKKLRHTGWLLRHHHHMLHHSAQGPMADTSRGQGRVLAVLQLQDGLSTKNLAYMLGMRVSSLNEVLAKLEEKGLVAREPDQNDKRVQLVKLTDEGRAQKMGAEGDSANDVFNVLNDDEKQTLGGLLDKVIEELEKQVSGDEEYQRIMEARSRFADQMGAEGLADPQFKHMFGGMPGFEVPHGPGHGPHGHGPCGPHGHGRGHGPGKGRCKGHGPHGKGPHGGGRGPHGHGPHGHRPKGPHPHKPNFPHGPFPNHTFMS